MELFSFTKTEVNPDCVRSACAGYQIQIELICRFTKYRDQALISISTIQEFPVQRRKLIQGKISRKPFQNSLNIST